MKLKVTEHFETIQGEGRFAGAPSLFIRLAGCNLRCWWCDTKFSSWSPEGETVEVAALCDLVRDSRSPDLVITGGEPMLFPEEVAFLTNAAKGCGKRVTIETAGTRWDGRVKPSLYSVSPKLASSTPGENFERERKLHLVNNVDTHLPTFANLAAWGAAQFKYVVSTDVDIAEVGMQVAHLGISPSNVWIMPEGTNAELMLERGRWAVEVCKTHGWNLCLRQHVLLWGNRRGV